MVTCTATDAAGNTTTASFGVTPRNTTPPEVSSTSPSDNATGVAQRTNLRAAFSEKMDLASITKSTFKLFRCPSATSTNCTTQVNNVTLSKSADGLSATLNLYGTPPIKLNAKSKYKAVVTTVMKDLAGNALDQNPAVAGNQQKVWYFTTGS
jgi:hypothetical protein